MSLLIKTKTHRLHGLQKMLQNDPMCFNEIISYYGTLGLKKSKRQIQRDVKELALYLDTGLELRTFFIRKEKFFFLAPIELGAKPPKELDPIIVSTRFYEPILTPEDDQKITILKKAIMKDLQIGVKAIINDETGDNAGFEKKEVNIIPIQLLYHRNNYYLGGYDEKKQSIGIFNIKQLVDVHLIPINGNAEQYQALFTKELQGRFGITKNINNTIYAIKVQVAPVLVAFIRNNQWHPTQKVRKEKNNYYLYLTCGINRELIGWLCQWMYNIKIIAPVILKTYYTKSLQKMSQNHQKEIPLVYRNIFEHNPSDTSYE